MAINSPKNDFAEKHRWLTYADEPDTVYDGSKIIDGSVTTDKLADVESNVIVAGQAILENEVF